MKTALVKLVLLTFLLGACASAPPDPRIDEVQAELAAFIDNSELFPSP